MENKLLLSFIVFSIATVGFLSYANAEEATIAVPFEFQKHGCTLTTNSTDHKVFNCDFEWKGETHKEPGEELAPIDDGCNNGFDIDITTGECRPFQDIQAEARLACDIDPTCPSGTYIPPTEKDKKIEALEDEIHLKPADKRLLHYLQEETAKCLQGQGQTLGIQNKRSFPIPTMEIPIFENVNGTMVNTGKTQIVLDTTTVLTSIDFKGELKRIKLFVGECKAQDTLLNPNGRVLSSPDARFGMCDRTTFTTPQESLLAGCGFVVKSHSQIATKVPVMTQSMANEKANFGLEKAPLRDEHAYVCSHNYSEGLRTAYNCPPLEPVPPGNGKFTEMKDYHANGPGERYQNYLNDDGDRMSKKLAKEAIEQKIAQLRETLKNYQ